MKAYKNTQFLDSPDARLLRIVAEFVEPAARFSRNEIEDTIVFMGSARAPEPADSAEAEPPPNDDTQAQHWKAMARYYQDCRELAKRITNWSKRLPEGHRRFVVCSGGGPGIMEAANRGASDADGINIGLGISLPNEQENNPHITRELSLEWSFIIFSCANFGLPTWQRPWCSFLAALALWTSFLKYLLSCRLAKSENTCLWSFLALTTGSGQSTSRC